jgi:hypothetical protein
VTAYDISLKLFTTSTVAPKELIPVFHRFIQTRALDELLIDVSDYSHVHDGPGVILVCHGAIYGLDEEGGRRGLLYRRRRDSGGSFDDKLLTVARAVVVAAEKLEAAAELAGRLRFSPAEIELAVSDRLHAPNTPATFERLRPSLDALAARLYGPGAAAVTHQVDARRRFLVTITGQGTLTLAQLASRLANEASRGGS